MYAVISDRNRQYRAAPGDRLELDRIEAATKAKNPQMAAWPRVGVVRAAMVSNAL